MNIFFVSKNWVQIALKHLDVVQKDWTIDQSWFIIGTVTFYCYSMEGRPHRYIKYTCMFSYHPRTKYKGTVRPVTWSLSPVRPAAGYPCTGYPPTPHHRTGPWQDLGVLPDKTNISCAAGSTPLAVMREDFLVSIVFRSGSRTSRRRRHELEKVPHKPAALHGISLTNCKNYLENEIFWQGGGANGNCLFLGLHSVL